MSYVGARRKRTVRGSGIMDILRGAHKLIKSTGAVSKGLHLLGQPGMSGVVKSFGYGRRTRTVAGRRRRPRRGRGGFSLPFGLGGVSW